MLKPCLRRLALPVLLGAQAVTAMAATGVQQQCAADLREIASFMPANDAGGGMLLADHGSAIAGAFEKALAEAARAADDAACQSAIDAYLHAWRPGHLAVVPPAANRGVAGSTARPGSNGGDDPRAPRFTALGKETILLTFPTFDDRYRGAVEKLLADHRAELESHPNWIVDVRANGGGSDSTYGQLLNWLLDGDFPVNMVEYLATPANIKAQEAICALTSDPKACDKQMAPTIAAMRAAAPGSFVLAGAERILYDHPDKLEAHRPARVAVLTDHRCGSSCEQFLLAARTGMRVKLVGRPSFGSLDYSNLRAHPLPSGRVLYYATTRSTRLPAMCIDGIGIAPDILLPAPVDDAGREAEVRQVQRWLESGSLRPQ